MGVDHKDYHMTSKLAKLLGRDEDGEQKKVPGRVSSTWRLNEQRTHLLKERLWDNFALSWAFWYHISTMTLRHSKT